LLPPPIFGPGTGTPSQPPTGAESRNPIANASPTLMPTPPYPTALIVGAGPGLGASLARVFTRDGGLRVMVAARKRDKLDAIAHETGAGVATCDATDAASVAALFEVATRHFGAAPEVVVYNASQRVRGAFVDVDAGAVEQAVRVTAYGAFLVAQQAARRMLPNGRGAILFTGASAGVKGYAQSAAFAMGKFALRGLAQSLARELSPLGIHVGHVVVDGGIRPSGDAGAETKDDRLDPDAIAATYLHLLSQPRNAWTWEIEVRPWVERF
jgi:NAD(P)-dependent dehydrogenase (short-subunit alcohol dehydrogenase family)